MKGEELTLPDPTDTPPECGVVRSPGVDRVEVRDRDGAVVVERWKDGRRFTPIETSHSDAIYLNEYSLIDLVARSFNPPEEAGVPAENYVDKLRITGVRGGTRYWLSPNCDPHATDFPRVFESTDVTGIEARESGVGTDGDQITHRVKIAPELLADLEDVRVVIIREELGSDGSVENIDARVRRVHHVGE